MIIKAMVKRQAKVKNKKISERLAKLEAKASLADRLVAVEFDTLADKLCTVKTEGLVDTVVYRVRGDSMLETCKGGRPDAYICTGSQALSGGGRKSWLHASQGGVQSGG